MLFYDVFIKGVLFISLPYSYSKWGKERKNKINVGGVNLPKHNINFILDAYNFPQKSKLQYKFCPEVKDKVSLYYLLGNNYRCLAENEYLINNDCGKCKEYLYMYLLSWSQAYNLWQDGLTVKNNAVNKAIATKEGFEHILYTAIILDDVNLISDYIANDSIVYALYCGDYIYAKKLLDNIQNDNQLSDEVYFQKEVYLKNILMSILDKDEKKFNSEMTLRIKKIRKNIVGYLTIIDITAIALIKIAAKSGIRYTLNVVEIPEYFLNESLVFDKHQFTLPI